MYSTSTNSRSSHVAATNAGIVTIAAIGSFLLWRSRHTPHHRHHDGNESSRQDQEHEELAEQQKQRGRLTLQHQIEQSGGSLSVSPIGHVRSIYRLCVGTPRQGLLAPNTRGRIEILSQYMDSFDGLQEFSHIWIVFAFHLNTINKSSTKAKKSTIAPPSLGGKKKVGVLATRSPHRPNPIGITLCRLDKVLASKGVICVSGLDLVDGTPVLDIKPYVSTYDSPLPTTASTDQSSTVPSWVSDGLETRRTVHVEPKALQQLRQILHDDADALEFYKGPTALDDVTKSIQQVLSVDVRSAWQTKKARQGQSKAERANRLREVARRTSRNEHDEGEGSPAVCSQQLDNLLIYFTVAAPQKSTRSASEGSGAEDKVVVHSIQLIRQKSLLDKPRPESRELQVPIIEGNHKHRMDRVDAKNEGKEVSDTAASAEKPPDPPAVANAISKATSKKLAPAVTTFAEENKHDASDVSQTTDILEKENSPIPPTGAGDSATTSNSIAKPPQLAQSPQVDTARAEDDATTKVAPSKKSTPMTPGIDSLTLKAQSPTLKARSPPLRAQPSPTGKSRSPLLKSKSPRLGPLRPRGSYTADSPSRAMTSSLVFSTMDTSSGLLQTHSSSASLSSLSPDAVSTAPKAAASEPKPTDADYSVLKTYWNAAAQKNTPQGLVPEAGDELAKSSSASSKKLFGGAKVTSFGP